jgi:hypothetical protein
MSVIDRLKSTEAVIGGVVALLAVVAKYAAISSVLDLPEGVAGIAPFLSTVSVIVFTLLIIFLSDAIVAVRQVIVGAAIAIMVIVGIILAAQFVSDIRTQSIEVGCTNEPDTLILEPAHPSGRLERLIDQGGGLENAWCEEDSTIVRRLVVRENADQVRALTLFLILAETLLTLAVTLAAWLVANRDGGAPTPARAPAPAAGSPQPPSPIDPPSANELPNG